MAVWHYRSSLVSRDGIIRHPGESPEELPGYRAVWHLDEADEQPTPRYDPPDVCERAARGLSAPLPPLKHGSKHAIAFGANEENRLEVWDHGDLFFKLSLLCPDLELFRKLAEVAASNRLLWVSSRLGRPLEPDFKAIPGDMMASPAYKFCQDPKGCLLSLKHPSQLKL